MDKISGVYEIKNIVNNHRYIGSTVNIFKRWHNHKRALRHNKHHSAYLQNAWDKYGEDNFEFNVLLICDKENNILYEQKCMEKMNPEYNISLTAGSSLGVKRTEETKRKMSLAQSGENHHMFGKHLSEETKRRMSIAQTGKSLSEEHIINLSGKNNHNYGKHLSKETRAKISVAFWKRVKENAKVPLELIKKSGIASFKHGLLTNHLGLQI